jgi:hypothetical protein
MLVHAPRDEGGHADGGRWQQVAVLMASGLQDSPLEKSILISWSMRVGHSASFLIVVKLRKVKLLHHPVKVDRSQLPGSTHCLIKVSQLSPFFG